MTYESTPSWVIEINDNGDVIAIRQAYDYNEKVNPPYEYLIKANYRKGAVKKALLAHHVRTGTPPKCKCGQPVDRKYQDGNYYWKCSRCYKPRSATTSTAAKQRMDRFNLSSTFQYINLCTQNVPETETSTAEPVRFYSGIHQKSMRLDILKEVQNAWTKSYNNGQFTTWLNSQIDKADKIPSNPQPSNSNHKRAI